MPSGKATCRQRDILLTRFPFSDLVGSKVRPVLVLSNDAYNRRFSDVLICAITSSPRPHEYATDLGATHNSKLDMGHSENLPPRYHRNSAVPVVAEPLVVMEFSSRSGVHGPSDHRPVMVTLDKRIGIPMA